MRLGYLVPRFVLLALVWAFFAFTFDPLLRHSLVFSARRFTGTRINVVKLATSFYPPTLRLDDVSIANRRSPERNLIEMQNVRLQLAGRPLLKRAYVIREGSISGLRWNAERDSPDFGDDWDPDFRWVDTLLDSLGANAGELGELAFSHSLDEAKRQLDPRQLESVQLARELEESWNDRFDRLEARIKSLESRVEVVEERVKQKGNALERIEAYRQAALEATRLLQEVEQIRSELNRLPATAQFDLRRIDSARWRDQQALARKLDVLKLEPAALSELLLGPELAGRLAETVGWIQLAGRVARHMTTDYEAERLRGLDVVFPRKDELPRFLIERLDVSGHAELGGEPVAFQGTLRGVTSDPKIYGRPLHLALRANKSETLELDAKIDQTSDSPVHEFTLAYTRPHRSVFELGDPGLLAIEVAAEQTTWQGRLRVGGDQIFAVLAVRQHPVQLVAQSDADRGRIGPTLNAAFSDLDTIEAKLTVAGTLREPKWTLQSNLGPQLADRFNHAAARVLDSRRKELAAEIDGIVAEQSQRLETMINNEFVKLTSKLNRDEVRFRRFW